MLSFLFPFPFPPYPLQHRRLTKLSVPSVLIMSLSFVDFHILEYSAAKAAIRAFSEALLFDARQNFNRVGVLSVHPGHIRTDIASLAVVKEDVTPEEMLRMRKQIEMMGR